MKSGLFVAVFFFFLNFQAYFSSNFKNQRLKKLMTFTEAMFILFSILLMGLKYIANKKC